MYQTLHKLKISHYLSKHFLTVNFLPFRFVYWLLKQISFSRTVRRNNVSYQVMVKKGVGLMNLIDQYEPWFEELLSEIITDGESVFLDVGANIGQTLLKVVPYYSNVKYIGIEPNRRCVSYLVDLAERNNYKNVLFYNYALSDKKGETELLLRFQDDILATTSPSFRKFTNYAEKEIVPIITGDELIQNESIERVDIIKIDVEGGEAKALSGLLNTIETWQPIIICEILPLQSKSKEVEEFRNASAAEILSIAENLNYSIHNIITRHIVREVKDFSPSLESANYLLLPADRHQDLKSRLNKS